MYQRVFVLHELVAVSQLQSPLHQALPMSVPLLSGHAPQFAARCPPQLTVAAGAATAVDVVAYWAT